MTEPHARLLVGNYFDKYHARHPVAQALVRGYLRELDRLVGRTEPRSILDLGCGEGYLTSRAYLGLSPSIAVGVDVSWTILSRARDVCASAGFVVASGYALPFHPKAFDLVLVTEVLEYMRSPHLALDEVVRVGRGYLLASVPREPFWRLANLARGAYVSSLGNTPGHVQHWTRSQFLRLLGAHVNVVEVASPFPWTIALCKVV